MRSLLISACFTAIALAGGCAKNDCREGVQRISPVDRVFMHEPGRYSVMTRYPQSPIVDIRTMDSLAYDVKLIADAPDNQPMWMEIIFDRSDLNGCHYRVAIHVHSPVEIGGAGWNHGKFGRGTTEVVE